MITSGFLTHPAFYILFKGSPVTIRILQTRKPQDHIRNWLVYESKGWPSSRTTVIPAGLCFPWNFPCRAQWSVDLRFSPDPRPEPFSLPLRPTYGSSIMHHFWKWTVPLGLSLGCEILLFWGLGKEKECTPLKGRESTLPLP